MLDYFVELQENSQIFLLYLACSVEPIKFGTRYYLVPIAKLLYKLSATVDSMNSTLLRISWLLMFKPHLLEKKEENKTDGSKNFCDFSRL